jgi:cyanoexosortase A
MKHTSKPLKFGLLGLLSALIALHLNLTFRSDNTDLIGSSVLYWLAVSLLLSRKHHDLTFNSTVLSSILGACLIAIVCLKSWFITGTDIFLRVSPVLSFIGVSLIASGKNTIKQFWREIFLLILFAIPPGAILLWIDPSVLTAKFAAFSLWCLGFQVSVQGVFISLPRGTTEVYSACSGVALMLQVLGVAFIYLFLNSVERHHKILLPAIALLLGFVINGFRIALLAVLTALQDTQAFDYWHVGNGSLIFSTISIVIFSLICQKLLPSEAEHGSAN